MYPMNRNFMEYLVTLVVTFTWWPTRLTKDGRRIVHLFRKHLKTAMPRRKNYANHHRQGVNFLVEDQVYLQATSLKGTKHFHVKGKLTPRFIAPLQDHCKKKNRRLPSRVTTWVTHCAQHFSTRHHFVNVSTFLTTPVSTRTSVTEPSPSSPIWPTRETPIAIRIKKNVIHEATPSSTPRIQWSTTRKQKQYEDVKTAPHQSFRIPFRV